MRNIVRYAYGADFCPLTQKRGSSSSVETAILSKRDYDVIIYPHVETSHQLLTIDATVEQKTLPEFCKKVENILQATCLLTIRWMEASIGSILAEFILHLSVLRMSGRALATPLANRMIRLIFEVLAFLTQRIIDHVATRS